MKIHSNGEHDNCNPERARYHGSRDIKMVDTKMVATNINNIVTSPFV